MGPLTKVPCVRCSDNTSTPSAFLLTCKNCNKTWHHRCHQPPIEDSELVARIRAFNSGDFENGITGWRCRRCTKGKGREQSSTAANTIVVSSIVERPSNLLRGQTQAKSTQAKSTRAKSTRSKPTLQPTTSHNPDAQSAPTTHRDAQPSGFRTLRNGLEPPLVQRNTAATPEVVDLTMSSDEETVQSPINEPKRPPHTRSQSKVQDQSKHPNRPAPLAANPPAPSPQPDPPIHHAPPTPPPVQARIDAPYIPSPSPPSPTPPVPRTQEVPAARPISPDPPTPPSQHHPIEPEPSTQAEAANFTEPKSEPELEAIPIGPVISPWQTYNLAPSWIRTRHEAINPWEESLVKQMAPTGISATKRKPAARHLSSGGGCGALFNFSSRTWLRTRE